MEGEPEAAKHKRWQLELIPQVLVFNERAVLDVAKRITAEDGEATA